MNEIIKSSGMDTEDMSKFLYKEYSNTKKKKKKKEKTWREADKLPKGTEKEWQVKQN